VIVILWLLIFVPHHKTDGRSCRLSFEDPGKEFNIISFTAPGHNVGLAGTSSVELRLYKIKVDRQAGRAAINDATQSGTMGLPECGQSKKLSEGIPSHKTDR
jgi:hypothetical protein